MIQASQTRMIDNKSSLPVEGKSSSSSLLNIEESLEGQEFASELEASLILDNELLVNPVPSNNTLNLPVNKNEIISPKIFDPSLAKDVEDVIKPNLSTHFIETTDTADLDVKNQEIQNILGSQPKLSVGNGINANRSPAIDFSPGEVDPELLSMEDFLAQKNLISKKPNQGTQGYGLPVRQETKAFDTVFPTQTITEVDVQANNAPVNSQQFILNMMNNQEQSSSLNLSTSDAVAAKVFDMNHVKGSNSTEIMNQITDYIVQAKAAKEPTVNMRVMHDELGMIDVMVRKAGSTNDSVAINIGAHSTDGKLFFQQNSKELLAHMGQAGISVTDFKVETSSQTAKNDFDLGSQNHRQNGSEKQFGSEQNQRRHESDRRQDLWKLFNQDVA